MLKILEDLLIEATCNPNVPGSIVAGLRKAVDAARGASLWPQEAEPATVRVSSSARHMQSEVDASCLPPPFDSQEEAQRAAGIWPPKPSAIDEMAEQMKRWAAPTRECVGPFRHEAADSKPALAVQEGGSHYKTMKIQPVEYIHANGLGYFEGNVVKYVSRWRAKGGLQDLKKARHYLDLLIELEGGTK